VDVVTAGVDRWHVVLTCRCCGSERGVEEATEMADEEFLAAQNHTSIKDGGEPVTILCPSCGHETYDLEEDCCLLCEESVERECQRCGMDIPASELDGEGYCSYCAHVMAKDD